MDAMKAISTKTCSICGKAFPQTMWIAGKKVRMYNRDACPVCKPMGKPHIPAEEQVGKQFGKLTILRLLEKPKGRSRRCLALCTCGKTKVMNLSPIVNGVIKSCGCTRVSTNTGKPRPPKKPFEESMVRRLLSIYTRNAAKRGLEWGLTTEQFVSIIHQPCRYCGRVDVDARRPSNHKHCLCHKGKVYMCNGVDRLDNTKGYTPENSVSCCEAHNDFKNDRTEAELVALCKLVADHYK